MRIFFLLAALALPLAAQQTLRIGTYDTRAVAVAYAHSQYLQDLLQPKRLELERAKAAGDSAKVRQLDEWGKTHQHQLHRQGFGRVPVTDLLAHVKDRLPEAAARANVIAIVPDCDFHAPNVEIIDVTGEIVRLYNPSPRVLSIVKDMKGKPPLSLDEIEKIKH